MTYRTVNFSELRVGRPLACRISSTSPSTSSTSTAFSCSATPPPLPPLPALPPSLPLSIPPINFFTFHFATLLWYSSTSILHHFHRFRYLRFLHPLHDIFLLVHLFLDPTLPRTLAPIHLQLFLHLSLDRFLHLLRHFLLLNLPQLPLPRSLPPLPTSLPDPPLHHLSARLPPPLPTLDIYSTFSPPPSPSPRPHLLLHRVLLHLQRKERIAV